MDINDILNSLGIDLTNPEAKRGAKEAIQAILDSRTPPPSMGMGGGGGLPGGVNKIDMEVDPDLILPSQKFTEPDGGDTDIEVEDDEDLLSQIKRNDSETDVNNTDGNSSGNSQSGDKTSNNSSSEEPTSTDSSESEESGASDNGSDAGETGSQGSDEAGDNAASAGTGEADSDKSGDADVDDAASAKSNDDDTNSSSGEPDGDLNGDSAEEAADDEESALNSKDNGPKEDSDSDNNSEFDEEDLLDDEIKNSYEDQAARAKHEARRIKRERTLAAAKTALEKAKAKNVPQSLIKELEKSIEALESLTEAKSKSLAEISDEEFNLMVNRVFDAISAVGDNDLTFTSDEERKIKAQEIKTDLGSRDTQQMLSDEDIAAIRAETQAVKAREKETAVYKTPSRGSFKGFKEFLNSLYRAIALQVQTNEVQDDTWSAINRRYSGTGVLKQGQRKNDLPDKKIPIIDFYFDQSGSWNEADIAAGKKAVEALVDMEEKGQIKINIFYFSNHVFNDAESARNEGGTWAWNDIVKNIIATNATNVVIMTDDDMEDRFDLEGYYGSGERKALKYTVPGYVWYLWRDGYSAPRLPRDLKGRGGVQQYSFNRGDV